MGNEVTTVQLKKSLVKALGQFKKYDRETYNEIIEGLLAFAKSEKMNSVYNDFIERSQQGKMSELWDNEADELMANV